LAETRKVAGFAGKNPRVRPLAVDKKFNPKKEDVDPSVLEKYDIKPGCILVIGNGLPHKNLGVLLKVAGEIPRKLVFVGVPEKNMALVGMAGVMAGVMQAPLTGIFLIAESTGGYELFTPLMFTAVISYLTMRMFESRSIYTKRLAERGELMTHDKDRNVLQMMSVSQLIETNFRKVNVNGTMRDFIKEVSKSQRNVFPVVDDDDNFYGVIFINDIRHMIFKTELWDTTKVRELMFMPDTIVDPGESMESVAAKFQTTDNYNLPVIKDGKYIGFVSRAKVFSTYRKLLREFSDE
jgi:CIC family chloride channel protein